MAATTASERSATSFVVMASPGISYWIILHKKGFSPFTCDLHGVAAAGDAAQEMITVRARDTRGTLGLRQHVNSGVARGRQPRGKQARE